MNKKTRQVKRFLVEVYVPRTRLGELPDAAARARSAARELARDGTDVRFLRALFVPEDETCFHLYEGKSADVIAEVSHRAGIRFESVSEAVHIDCEEDR